MPGRSVTRSITIPPAGSSSTNVSSLKGINKMFSYTHMVDSRQVPSNALCHGFTPQPRGAPGAAPTAIHFTCTATATKTDK